MLIALVLPLTLSRPVKGLLFRLLSFAHRKFNILLSRGRPLVAEFEVALAVSAAGGGRLTEIGLSLGTPHYMSPEQATGGQTVDPATGHLRAGLCAILHHDPCGSAGGVEGAAQWTRRILFDDGCLRLILGIWTTWPRPGA